ncbi:hypothetical protein M409DRAFT_70797 [Zasmidium cellare ATCC 36951]|uniref:Xaa-Pro dipeptidyl-peptidase C-terminal domain-containing protein n=1 Tax=Zasmidium cellare ATCC 36951 TaxID=1080233 RepID=A0A6A6BY63_ZASCE|nr:uncharacterized protein M409DRAFT_70797 [Zasmidium cellare ATCC 36951]KAF2159731.1 hypothetical protein M409DRAFT_70797 [Zasmidium cellare ATCC 36951]
MQTSMNKVQGLFPDLPYVKLIPAHRHPSFNYKGFHPGRTILNKGHVREAGLRTFPTDVIFEHDQTVTLRDGIKLYADIFRPLQSDTDAVPVIIAWSPYGKSGTGAHNYDNMIPFRAGYSKDKWSGYQKFEAPDPAEWCQRGYAVLNIDSRGSGVSEGDLAIYGLQEAEDIFDTIDFISKQPWCNGSVCMAGNSWLAISQINFAARLSHPALKAFAPWEGFTDYYRERIARGSIPYLPLFQKSLAGSLAGASSMLVSRPLYDEFWETKRIPVENIDHIPLYLVASYSSLLHSHGSFTTFRDAKTGLKWLRIHPYQEWHDQYRPEILDDLQKFFDRYCKGILNSWENDTPRVRLSLLGFEEDGGLASTIVERPEREYPLAREMMQVLFLDASDMSMKPRVPSLGVHCAYEAHGMHEAVEFSACFDTYTEIAGYPKLKVFVSCADHDDMDVVCQLRKVNSKGEALEQPTFPHPSPVRQRPDLNTAKILGPQGFLRASHAISRNDSNTIGNDIFYEHNRKQAVQRGEIVELEIPIWPVGFVLAPGEGIMLRISGQDMSLPELPDCVATEPWDHNVGRHSVFTGAQYASALTLPIVQQIARSAL